MSPMDGTEPCTYDGCLMWSWGTELREAQGWVEVDGKPYCLDHAPLAALVALNTTRRGLVEHRQRQKEARMKMTTRDYAAWNEFQQDLTDYHRTHGKLAPAAIRNLSPKQWLAGYKKHGKLDVETQAAELEVAEQSLAERIRDRLG